MRTDETVKYFGDKTTLARAIGITPSAIGNWGELVPMGRRKSVRMAMKERADLLEAQAKEMRKKAKEE